MAAGALLQIASIGPEDVFLTYEPQITFFKTVYRRHSNFTLFQHKLLFNNNLAWNTESICKIQKFGDLLNKLYLVVELPSVLTYSSIEYRKGIKIILDQYDIDWSYIIDDVLDENDLLTILLLITNKINEYTDKINQYDIIKTRILAPTTDTTATYITKIIINLLETQYCILYEYIYSIILDNINIPIYNLDDINRILYYTIRNYASSEIFVIKHDTTTYIDENLIFVSNIEFETYNIVNTIDMLALMLSSLKYTYTNNEYITYDYTELDAYKTLLNICNKLGTITISTNTELYNIRSYIIKNIRLNIQLNIEVVYNLFKLLSSQRYNFVVFKRYKSQSGKQANDATGRFINISQVQSLTFSRLDKFTAYVLERSDFAHSEYIELAHENMYHFYGEYINTSIQTFHNNILNLFNDSTYKDYFGNNITTFDVNTILLSSNTYNKTLLWNRLEITQYVSSLANDTALAKTFNNIYIMNYIPFLTIADLKNELIKYTSVIFESEPDFITTFTGIFTQLNTTLTTNLDIIKLTLSEISDISEIVASYKQKTGDILVLGLLRPEYNFASLVNQTGYVSALMYIKIMYINTLNGITDTVFKNHPNYSTIYTIYMTVINSFFVDHDNIPIYTTYQKNKYRIYDTIHIAYTIDTTNIISDVITSIWYNIQNNFIDIYNSLYNDNILNITYIKNNFGIEIYSTVKYIIDNYINGIYKQVNNNNIYVDYYLLTTDIIYNENTSLFTSIVSYCNQLHTLYYTYFTNYDRTKSLLNVKYIQLNRSYMYYNTVDNIINAINQYINNIYYNFGTQDSELSNILSIVENNILSSYSNVMNVVNNIIDNYTTILHSTTNPYTNGTNMYIWYEKYRIDTLDDMYRQLYINTMTNLFSNISSTFFYTDIRTISNNYNSFQYSINIYQYILDLIAKDILSILKTLQISTLTSNIEIYTSIQNYYTTCKTELENKKRLIDSSGNSKNEYKLYTLIKDKITTHVEKFAWIQDIGYFLIDYIELEINGQLIDRRTGKWLYIWNNLTCTTGHKKSNDIMLGNRDILTTYNTKQKETYTMYIPLEYWFCRYVEESLPLVALQYSNISIKVRCKDIQSICYYETNIPKIHIQGYLLGEFIYVDADERDKLGTSKHEYLVESIIESEILVDYSKIHDKLNGIIEIPIRNNNLCKEIIWTITTQTNIDHKLHNIFTYNNMNPCTYATIFFSGRERESSYIEYFNYINPYKCHTAIPEKGINVYSFSLYPELMQPSGCANFSQIDDIKLILRLQPELVTMMKNENEKIIINVYIITQNILRVMSGLSGLAFYS